MFQINATEGTTLEVTPAVSVECFGLSAIASDHDGREREQFLIADVVHSMFVQQTSLSFREQTGLVGGSRGKLLAITAADNGEALGMSGRALARLSERVGTLTPLFIRQPSTEDLTETLQAALDSAVPSNGDRSIRSDMTLSAAYLLWPDVHVMNLGHGAAYLMRRGMLGRLTGADPCEVASATSDDRIALPGYLFSGPHLGASRSEIRRERLRANDAVVLCSRALPDHVSDERIAAALRLATSPEAACRALIEEVKRAGCDHAVTVLVAHCRAS